MGEILDLGFRIEVLILRMLANTRGFHSSSSFQYRSARQSLFFFFLIMPRHVSLEFEVMTWLYLPTLGLTYVVVHHDFFFFFRLSLSFVHIDVPSFICRRGKKEKKKSARLLPPCLCEKKIKAKPDPLDGIPCTPSLPQTPRFGPSSLFPSSHRIKHASTPGCFPSMSFFSVISRHTPHIISFVPFFSLSCYIKIFAS